MRPVVAAGPGGAASLSGIAAPLSLSLGFPSLRFSRSELPLFHTPPRY